MSTTLGPRPLAALAVFAAVFVAGCTVPTSGNEPPVAVFSLDREVVEVDDLVVFNGNSSHDAEGAIVLYQWNFGDGSEEVGPVVAHRYGASGVYAVALTVTDSEGAGNTRAANLAVNAPPVASLEVSPGPYFAKEPIAFSAAASGDPDGRIVALEWQFGDGETSSLSSVAHAYADTGTFGVRLQVTDDRGARATASTSIFADLHTYDVTFSDQTYDQMPVRNFTLANQTKTVTLEIFILNITRVDIALTWRDPFPVMGPPNDVIQLKVTTPDGPSQTMIGTFDNITLEFNLNAIPGDVQVRAATPGDVPGVLGDAYLGQKGRGVWVIEITALTLGGGLAQDGGFVPEPLFFWTLTTSVTAYEASPEQIA